MIWNHRSTIPPANNSGYEVTQFDLVLSDSSGGTLLTMNDVALLPDRLTGQVIEFGSVVDNVSMARFDIDSVQFSPDFTGLAEVAFNATAVPEPSSFALSIIAIGAFGTSAFLKRRRRRNISRCE